MLGMSGTGLAQGNAPGRDHLLFMHGPDVENVSGRVTFVSNPVRPLHKKTGTSMDHTYATAQQADGSWVAYGMRVVGGDNHQPHPGKDYIQCKAKTANGYNFTEREERPWDGNGPGAQGMLQQTMAYNAKDKECLLLYYELSKPHDQGYALKAYKSPDGLAFTAVAGNPVYYGHDAFHAMRDPKSGDYFCYQTAFQPWTKKYPDNGQQGRRVITIRRSHDGITWTPKWNSWTVGPGFAPEYLLTPDANDPVDLEFYWFSAFPYAGRYIGIVSLYEPCPPEVNPRHPNQPNAHGPYLGYEWWISHDAIHWLRPYQTQYLGLEPGDKSVFAQGVFLAPPGSPIVANGEILWDGAWGVQEDRIAGIAAGPNAEFSSHKFKMPASPLLLNATASWVGKKEPIFLQRQAYIMAELLDGQGRVIPGYERKNCVFGDADSSELPLVWGGKNGAELAGKTVQLRFYFRDARIYAVTAKKAIITVE